MSSPVPTPSAAAADAVATPDRFAARRLLRVWLGVAVLEALLYLLLHRSPELKGLYRLPAVAVLAAGLILSWHARRHREGHERRHTERRHDAD